MAIFFQVPPCKSNAISQNPFYYAFFFVCMASHPKTCPMKPLNFYLKLVPAPIQYTSIPHEKGYFLHFLSIFGKVFLKWNTLYVKRLLTHLNPYMVCPFFYFIVKIFGVRVGVQQQKKLDFQGFFLIVVYLQFLDARSSLFRRFAPFNRTTLNLN